MTISQLLVSTLQVLRLLLCHDSTLQVLRPAPFSIFQKHFIKPKLTLGNIVIFPTVHDRELDYSNRFTLCRGCTLYPQDSINPPGCHNRPSYKSMRGSDNQTEPSIYLPQYGCLPCGVNLPVKPWQPTSIECSSSATARETQVSSGRVAYWQARHTIAHHFATIRIPGSYKPPYSARLPALRQINFGLSPVPYRGNVAA
jgi:hypothetical protein